MYTTQYLQSIQKPITPHKMLVPQRPLDTPSCMLEDLLLLPPHSAALGHLPFAAVCVALGAGGFADLLAGLPSALASASVLLLQTLQVLLLQVFTSIRYGAPPTGASSAPLGTKTTGLLSDLLTVEKGDLLGLPAQLSMLGILLLVSLLGWVVVAKCGRRRGTQSRRKAVTSRRGQRRLQRYKGQAHVIRYDDK